jgi:hypothetical protein
MINWTTALTPRFHGLDRLAAEGVNQRPHNAFNRHGCVFNRCELLVRHCAPIVRRDRLHHFVRSRR